MNRRNLVSLALMLLASSCCSYGNKKDGLIEVVPEWKENSQEIYLEWMNDPNLMQNVERFQQAMMYEIEARLGAKFPTAKMPRADKAQILGMIGNQPPTDATRKPPKTTGAKATSSADPIEDQIEAAVHDAVNGADPNLHVSGYEPSSLAVRYVIHDGVVYCIYGTWVVDTMGITGQPDWWDVSFEGTDGRTVTAYLDLVATVKRVY